MRALLFFFLSFFGFNPLLLLRGYPQRKFSDDATTRPQLVSSKRVEQLRRLISHLSAPYSTVHYLQEYTDSRCKFITTTLKKISSDAPPLAASDGLAYVRGTHRVILVTRVVLQLCTHEEWLASSVLPHSAYGMAFAPIAETIADAQSGEGEMLTKERGTDTLLPAMDACQLLSSLLPKFNAVLGSVCITLLFVLLDVVN